MILVGSQGGKKVLHCDQCNAIFAEEGWRDGFTVMVIGEIDLYKLHGWHVCSSDGIEYQVHWESGRIRHRNRIKPPGSLN